MIYSPFFYRPKMQKTASNTLKSLINQEAHFAKKTRIPQNVPHESRFKGMLGRFALPI